MKINIISIVAIALFLCAASFVFSQANTIAHNLNEIYTIEIEYISENINIYESATNELIVKEYLSENDKKYFAEVSVSGSVLKIKHGWREDVIKSYNDHIDLFIPKAYNKSLKIKTLSGSIKSNINLNIADLDFYSTSGDINSLNSKAGCISLKAISGNIKTGLIEGEKVKIQTLSGNIVTQNINGATNINTASGNIISAIIAGENISIETTSGFIKIKAIKSKQPNLKTLSNYIQIDKIVGNATIYTASGVININHLQGSGTINSTSGSINVRKIYGNAKMETLSGNITANFINDVTKDIYAKTANGKVSLSLPVDLSFYLEAKTLSGHIITSLKDNNNNSKKIKSVSKQIGDAPKLKVEAITTSGQINISNK